MKLIIVFSLILSIASMANSGDYGLTISDDPDAPCAPSIASRENWNNPIRTSTEICQDIYRYFCGEKPELRIFKAAFGNAHIRFCGKKEKEIIYKAFLTVICFEQITHEDHLYDYMYMLGNRDLLKLIDIELSKNNSPLIQERLNKARRAVSKRYR